MPKHLEPGFCLLVCLFSTVPKLGKHGQLYSTWDMFTADSNLYAAQAKGKWLVSTKGHG